MIQRLAIGLATFAVIVALCLHASAQNSLPLVDPPSSGDVTWYNTASPWPSPITSAYVGIGGALGAGNIYNTATNGFGTAGTGLLGTNTCAFLCYGSPGVASANVLAIGNDVSSPNPDSFTTIGAPDDCKTSGAPPCPGGIKDQVFSIEGYASPGATPTVLVSIDLNANFAVFDNVYAGAAIIAGAGTGNPFPSPTPGSLVSYTGTGAGDVLLGSAGTGNYVKCDYGETNAKALTCDQPLIVSNGGVQPNGPTGGYAPEAFPQGVATAHPQILTGSCSVTAPSTGCTFPGSLFPDTTYNCTISAQGTTGVSDSYVKTSASEITIYSATSTTFSYMCMR